MKLARYETGNGAKIGIVEGDTIQEISFDGSMVELISDWATIAPTIDGLKTGQSYAVSDVHLLAPVARPGKIFAIGLNYADHIEESKMETPANQVWFTKAVTSVNGPFDPILIAKDGPYVDYEVELVAVIGKGGKHISASEAPAHIFGYCVGNDVTERFWQHRTPQWTLGKSFDTHAPIGPWITTADDVSDPHVLDLSCSVNGEVRQNSNTQHLVFDIWQQIEHLSAGMTLEPGDIIFTGTPGGVGAAMDPRKFLQPGDVVSCEVAGIGSIEAKMVGES